MLVVVLFAIACLGLLVTYRFVFLPRYWQGQAEGANPLVWVPAVEQARIGETTVKVPAYRIQRFEVSYREYELCRRAGICSELEDLGLHNKSGLQDYPVVMVSAYQAQTFCRWLGYRLPTEVEWERIARGLDGHSDWPWGTKSPPTPELLNVAYLDDFNQTPVLKRKAEPTRSLPAGAVAGLGIHHLAGNVWEWTASAYIETDYAHNVDVWDLRSPKASPSRLTVRGGGYRTTLDSIDERSDYPPSSRDVDLGFRCAR